MGKGQYKSEISVFYSIRVSAENWLIYLCDTELSIQIYIKIGTIEEPLEI